MFIVLEIHTVILPMDNVNVSLDGLELIAMLKLALIIVTIEEFAIMVLANAKQVTQDNIVKLLKLAQIIALEMDNVIMDNVIVFQDIMVLIVQNLYAHKAVIKKEIVINL